MYDSRLLTGKLKRWEKFMTKYSLPGYDEIPNLGLYMDQVLTLMTQYLALMTTGEADNTVITAATINNYVRVKVMPAPEKKKYLRLHIAYLIIICTLKQSMSISDIQKIIPADLTDEEMAPIYNDYMRSYKESVLFFIDQVKDEVDTILSKGTKLLEEEKAALSGTVAEVEEETENAIAESETTDEKRKDKKDKDKTKNEVKPEPTPAQRAFDHAVIELVFSAATISNFSKLLTSKLIALDDSEFSEEAVAERLP